MNNPLIKTQAYINGQFVAGQQGYYFDVRNPATGELICQVTDLAVEDIQQAIDYAVIAQKQWAKLSVKERASKLLTWHKLILEQVEPLAQLLSLEQGKPLAESRGEIYYGASYIEWFAEEAKRIQGDMLPQNNPNQRGFVIKQPVGVVAAITPWNFPNAMITRKVAPALAAGCSILLKPATETPLSALALAELAHQAGIPAGVLNILPTSRNSDVGKLLCESDQIRKLSFTGSTQVGKILMQQCANNVKKISLELGGNAPSIVFNDADLDNAVDNIIASKFRNAGQTCICTNRIYVQKGIYELFLQKFVAKARTLKVGIATEENVAMGPLINQKAVEKVQVHIQDALQKGAELVLGGELHPLGGTFFSPTVLKNANQYMRVAKEETFAPLAPIFQFKDEEEAITMANDTEFGLAAYLYTQDYTRQWRVAEQLEYGMVGINEGLISNETAPFGGIKQSGLGREGSIYGIDEYLEMKYLCMKL